MILEFASKGLLVDWDQENEKFVVAGAEKKLIEEDRMSLLAR